MRKFLLFASFTLLSLAGFAQIGTDSCFKAKNFPLCNPKTLNGENNTNATDDGGVPTTCTIRKGLWYTFKTLNGGNATVTITRVGGSSMTSASILRGPCGSQTEVASACSFTGVKTISLTGLTPNTDYYILVGSATNASTIFNITLSSAIDVILSNPDVKVSLNPNQPYLCAKFNPDSSLTISNNTDEHGGNIRYQFIFEPLSPATAPKKTISSKIKSTDQTLPLNPGEYTDTTINLIRTCGDCDSIDITLIAQNECSNNPFPRKTQRIYLQKLDAKFDSLKHEQCGQSPILFKAVFPLQPNYPKAGIAAKDSAIVDSLVWHIVTPCESFFDTVPNTGSYITTYSYQPKCSKYADYDVKASVKLKGTCSYNYEVSAYDISGNFMGYQRNPTDFEVKVTVFAPPQVAPAYSKDGVVPYTSAGNELCSGVDAHIKLPRVTKRGHGAFTYTVTPQAGSQGTATITDSTVTIAGLPINNGTGFITQKYNVHVSDGKGCDGDTVATVVIRPEVGVQGSITSDPYVCTKGTFDLAATQTSGAGALTYKWTPTSGIATQDFSTGTATTRSLTVTTTFYLQGTDVYGCTSPLDSVEAVVYTAPKLAPSIVGVDSVCAGNDNTVKILANVTPGSAGVGGLVYGYPSGFTQTMGGAGATSSMIREAATFQVTVKDVYGCTDTAYTSVKNASKPKLTVTKPALNCQRTPGKTATFALSNVPKLGPTPPTFTWTGIPAGFSPSTTTAQSQTFAIGSTVAAGSYPISITISYPGATNACDTTVTDTIKIAASPYATVAFTPANDIVCIGQNIHIVASDATDGTNSDIYTFGTHAPGNTFDSAYVNATPSIKTIALHVSRGTCTQDTNITVTVLPDPTAPVVNGIQLSVCEDAPFSYSIATPNAQSTYTWTITPVSGSATQPSPLTGTGSTFIGNLGKAIDKNTPATYTVSVYETNSNGCKGATYTSGTITVNPKPITHGLDGSLGSTFNDNSVCSGDTKQYQVPQANGTSSFNWTINPPSSGTVTAGQGTKTVTIKWFTTTMLPAPTADIHVVETRSSAMCQGDTVLTVTINPNPVVTIPTTNPSSFCEDSVYTVSVNPYNGIFNWTVTPNPTNVTIISGNGTKDIVIRTITSVPVPPNNTVGFNISLTDTVTGCFSQAPAVIGPLTIYKTPSATINKAALASHTLCQGSSISLKGSVRPSSPNPKPNVTWAKAALTSGDIALGTISVANDSTATYNAAANDLGDVVITITASNMACRDGVDTLILHVVQQPTVNILRTSTPLKCQGDTVNLHDVTTNYPGGIAWTKSNAGSGSYTGNFTPSATVLNPVYVSSPLENGNTTLTVTASSSVQGCISATDNIIVPFNIKPFAKINPSLSIPRRICSGSGPQIVAMRAPSQGTATWSIISGVGTFIPSGLNFIYTPPATLSGPPVKVVIGLKAMNPPCDDTMDTTSFYVIPEPKVVIISPTTGTGYCLDGTTPSIPLKTTSTNTTAGTVYAWSAKDPSNVTLSSSRFVDPAQPNTTYNAAPTDQAGSYILRVDVTEMGCTAFDNVTINLVKPATADIPPSDPIVSSTGLLLSFDPVINMYKRCQSDDRNILFSHTVFTPSIPDLIFWSAYTNGANTSNFTSQVSANTTYIFGAADTGITKIYLKVFKAPCDTARDSIMIRTIPTPKATSIFVGIPDPAKPVCFGSNVPLDVTLGTGPLPAYQYSWNASPNTGTWDPSQVVKATSYVKPTANTTFTVVVTDGACSKTLTASIKVVNADKIHLPKTAYCVSEPVDMLSVAIDPNSSTKKGKWSTPTDPMGTLFTPTDTTTIGNVTYKVNETDTLNKGVVIRFTSDEPNCANTLYDSVIVAIKLSSVLHVNPLTTDSVRQGELFEMPLAKVTGSDNLPGIQGSAYWKSDGTGKFIDANGNEDNVDPRFYVPSDADYLAGKIRLTYNLNAADNCNQGFITREIGVKVVRVPTVFTPDGDGVNDNFDLSGLPEHLHLKIFDRWGKLVYEKEDYDNSWDAKDVSAGTYYYVATYKLGSKHGWIQVFKK